MARFVESTITFPYKRSLGPVVGAFMTALTEKRILGIRSGDGVLVPPMEWDPATGAELPHEFVEVGPAGTVESWTWVPTPSEQHPLDHPFAFALIRLDGATTPLLHAVDAGAPERHGRRDAGGAALEGHPGGAHRRHRLLRARRGPETEGDDAGPAAEPVTRMDYLASITYRNPVPEATDRAVEASREHRLLGLALPDLRAGLRRRAGLLPDRRRRARAGLRGRPAPHRHHHQLRHRHAGAVPGPDRDRAVRPGLRPARRHRRDHPLPGGDRAARPTRCGSASGSTRSGRRRPRRPTRAAAWAGAWGSLLGWIPNGEPDVDDPDLVNRIF